MFLFRRRNEKVTPGHPLERALRTGAAEAFKAFQNVRCPHENVSSGNDAAHGSHPHVTLFRVHVYCPADRARKSVDVIRIDQERFPQLIGGTRKRAQHEHSVLIIARSHKLFRDQIHSVGERAHHSEMRQTVERDEIGKRGHAGVFHRNTRHKSVGCEHKCSR